MQAGRARAIAICLATLPAFPPVRAAAAPAPASFELDELRVEGNSVLSEREIDDIVYPFLGPGRTAADVEQRTLRPRVLLRQARLRDRLSRWYRRKIRTDGVVVVQVVERTVGRLRVVGGAIRHAQLASAPRAPSLTPRAAVPDT